MKDEIDKREYDICLLGCGAYGFPLAAHIKRRKKKAFHLGGVLQLLFGIKGNRWVNNPIHEMNSGLPIGSYVNLMNEYWIRPANQLISKNAEQVENSCYW
jgi:hypothetical protein